MPLSSTAAAATTASRPRRCRRASRSSPSMAAPATTPRQPGADVLSAATATTSSTATKATTPPSSAPATTCSSGTRATATTSIEGQDGIDTMHFNGANIAENIDISANGGRVRFTRDVANITMDLNDVEHIDFKALGGADNIVVNDLSGTDAHGGWRPYRSCRQRWRAATARWTASRSTARPATRSLRSSRMPALSASTAPPLRWRSSMPKAATNWSSTAAPATTRSTPPASPLGTIRLTLDGGAGDDTIIGAQGSETSSRRGRQ